MWRHKQTHKGLTPAKAKILCLKNKDKKAFSYVCDICDKSYYDRSTLTRHQNRVHGVKKPSNVIESEVKVTDIVNASDQIEQNNNVESEVVCPHIKSVEQEILVDSNKALPYAEVHKERIELTKEVENRLFEVLEG